MGVKLEIYVWLEQICSSLGSIIPDAFGVTQELQARARAPAACRTAAGQQRYQHRAGIDLSLLFHLMSSALALRRCGMKKTRLPEGVKSETGPLDCYCQIWIRGSLQNSILSFDFSTHSPKSQHGISRPAVIVTISISRAGLSFLSRFNNNTCPCSLAPTPDITRCSPKQQSL